MFEDVTEGERAGVPASVALQRIEDALIEDILRLSEDEMRAEMAEDGLDFDAEVAKARAIFEDALRAAPPQPARARKETQREGW